MTRLMIFAAGSVLLAALSRKSLLAPRSHGFFRFFAWEAILALILLNAPAWFLDPLAPRQILSWLLLMGSLIPLIAGIRSLREHGGARGAREGDPTLLPLEATTALITTGIYGLIRHPLYTSLLLLTWGSFFKSVSWAGAVLASAASLFLVATARADESECLRFFGEPYRRYMRRTRMFIPHIL
jgi:protein-S-isoprenylcysteine O-methyltransferase Ste14